MDNKIHISTARKMLEAGEPLDLRVWKSDGGIIEYNNCIPLRYDFYKGTRQIKLLASREIRTIRDVSIISVNGLEMFL